MKSESEDLLCNQIIYLVLKILISYVLFEILGFFLFFIHMFLLRLRSFKKPTFVFKEKLNNTFFPIDFFLLK